MNTSALERAALIVAAVAVPGAVVAALIVVADVLFRFSRTRQGFSNVPPPRTWGNLARAAAVVDRMSPIASFTNVYRGEELNDAVGGQPTSAHLRGAGVDFVPRPGFTMDDVEAAAEVLADEGALSLVYNEADHIHVELARGWTPPGPRGALARTLDAVTGGA